MFRFHASILAVLVTIHSVAAQAAEPAKAVELEFEIGAVSDYRFRGISLTDNGPALQGGVTATLKNGAYAYAWASQIDEYGAGSNGEGAQVETDLVAGWSGAVGKFEVDASVQAYLYPGGTDVDYAEFPLSVSRQMGDWRWTAGAAYAPRQRGVGDEDNLYRWGAARWATPSIPFEVNVSAGYETGAFAPGGKWDWSLGVRHDFGAFALGATYVDSDAPDGSATVVGALSATF
jgi:uncharacterized protein (TIGR02001 family)